VFYEQHSGNKPAFRAICEWFVLCRLILVYQGADGSDLQRHQAPRVHARCLSVHLCRLLACPRCEYLQSSNLHCGIACWTQASLSLSIIMSSLAVLVSATVLFVQSTVAFNCSTKPIYVDIHKRAVHDSPIFQYGSFIGIGTGDTASATSAQNHSLWPSLSQNHMSFGAHNYCDKSTLSKCQESTGGFFSSNQSTT
jgi:hypothetical protein